MTSKNASFSKYTLISPEISPYSTDAKRLISQLGKRDIVSYIRMKTPRLFSHLIVTLKLISLLRINKCYEEVASIAIFAHVTKKLDR
jgi:hypothetical protein